MEIRNTNGTSGHAGRITLYSFGLDGAYDIEKDIMYLGPDCKVVDCGDVDMVHGDLEQSFENAEESIRKIVATGAMPVVMGGDHSVTIPVGRALDVSEHSMSFRSMRIWIGRITVLDKGTGMEARFAA